MSLALSPNCCCVALTPANCLTNFDLEITNGPAGLNGIYNLGALTTTGPSSGVVCGNSISWNQYCRWDYDSAMPACAFGSEIDLDIFIDTTEVHVWLEFLAPVNVTWFKTIPGAFAFPITLSPADYQNTSPCNSSETPCDLSGATIILSQ